MIKEAIVSSILIAGANYTDVHTTRMGFNIGMHEGNPIVGKNVIPMKSLAVGIEIGAVSYLFKHRKKKEAWILTGVIVIGNGLIAHHNYQEYRKTLGRK